MIPFLQSVQIMESKRVGFFLRVRIPKLSGRSAANTVACKGHWPNTIVRSLVPVCLSVFLSLCISNTMAQYNSSLAGSRLYFCLCVFQLLFPLNTIVQLPVPIINLSMNLMFVIAKTV